MANKFRVGILGAGLGSRLNSSAGAKPLAPVLGGRSLLELLVSRLRKSGVNTISCALRAEQFNAELRSLLPQAPGLTYLFADTESSLHTLAELIKKLEAAKGPALFMMADTVMLPDDFTRFLAFCGALPEGANAVLVTPHVDDEKPLWVDVDAAGLVTRFGSEKGAYVTSGMYFLSPAAMKIALEEVAAGTHKMRNFLSKMAERKLPINSFVVAKTIDVDHPSDLQKAAEFLQADTGRTS
jgi:NDP-sugar pyrophosphorylase family protein